VVEDELLLHDVLQDPLEDGGFTVHLVSSSGEALAALDAPGADYRGLITDIRLGRGEPTGWDVAKRARELNAAIAVIYISADGGTDWSANGVPNSIMLNKPFAPAQLVTAVAQLLNAGEPPSQE
jgi:DNA-binding response OmpR family regulator